MVPYLKSKIRRRLARKWYGEGVPSKWIAKWLGVTQPQVLEGYVKDLPKHVQMKSRNRERAVELYSQGIPGTEIAKRLGISRERVYQFCRAAGIIRSRAEVQKRDWKKDPKNGGENDRGD